MASLTVSTKGQVVLPVEVRRKLGIVGGSKLEFEVAGSEIILRSPRPAPIRPEDCVGLVKNSVGPISVEQMDVLLAKALRKESGH